MNKGFIIFLSGLTIFISLLLVMIVSLLIFNIRQENKMSQQNHQDSQKLIEVIKNF